MAACRHINPVARRGRAQGSGRHNVPFLGPTYPAAAQTADGRIEVHIVEGSQSTIAGKNIIRAIAKKCAMT